MRPRPLRVALLAAAATVVGIATLVAVADAEPGIGGVQVMPPLLGSPTPSTAAYGALACPALGATCTAVGPSILGAAGGRPTAAVGKSGHWARTAIELPPGGVDGGRVPPVLNAVACPHDGSCVAVGTFASRLGADYPMVATESGGTWHRAVGLALPAVSVVGGLQSIWCASPTACEAVGYASSSAATIRPTAYALAADGWSAPTVLPAPRGATGDLLPLDVTCAAAGSCVAVGIATSATGVAGGSVVWREVAGRWRAPVRLAAVGGTFVASAVACPGASTCLAVGGIDHGASTWPATAAAANGTWSPATRLPTPRLSPRSPLGDLADVSCPSTTTCEAVGHFAASTSPAAAGVAGAVTWTGGAWSTVDFARAIPAGAERSNDASFDAVACATATVCVAVGGASVVPSGARLAVDPFAAQLATARAATSPGPPASVTATPRLDGVQLGWTDPADDGGATVTSFTATLGGGAGSCTTPAHGCTLAGLVDGRRYAVSVTDATTAGTSATAASTTFVAGRPPTPPTMVRAAAATRAARVAWAGSRAPAGESVTSYAVTATSGRERHRCTTSTTACTVHELVAGRSYVVRVVAMDQSGASSPSFAVRVVAR